MTTTAMQKQIAALQADVRELKKAVKVSADVEAARARLRAEIMKGLESGPAKPIDAGYWKRLHALAKRHARKA